MATVVTNSLILNSTGMPIEMYLNDSGEIFVAAKDENEMAAMFWFVITKEDWEEMKSFIDGEFFAIEK